MFKNYRNNIELFHFENLSNCGEIAHFVSTRKGGESTPPFDSLNFGLSSGDNPIKVLRNREKLANVLNISTENFVTVKQVHGDNVWILTTDEIRNIHSGKNIPKVEADAMITNLPNFCLAIAIADCVPILLYDRHKKVIGLAHSGWKGTIKKIAGKVVKTMMDKFGCKESNIIAGIGPSVGPCCYEVGKEIVGRAADSLGERAGLFFKDTDKGKAYFDLWAANKSILIENGISENNLEVAELCTKCNSEWFYSYRRQGGKCGKHAAGIMNL